VKGKRKWMLIMEKNCSHNEIHSSFSNG